MNIFKEFLEQGKDAPIAPSSALGQLYKKAIMPKPDKLDAAVESNPEMEVKSEIETKAEDDASKPMLQHEIEIAMLHNHSPEQHREYTLTGEKIESPLGSLKDFGSVKKFELAWEGEIQSSKKAYGWDDKENSIESRDDIFNRKINENTREQEFIKAREKNTSDIEEEQIRHKKEMNMLKGYDDIEEEVEVEKEEESMTEKRNREFTEERDAKADERKGSGDIRKSLNQ